MENHLSLTKWIPQLSVALPTLKLNVPLAKIPTDLLILCLCVANVKIFKKKLGRLAERIRSDDCSGQFHWVDSVLVKALREGHWLLISNANFCRYTHARTHPPTHTHTYTYTHTHTHTHTLTYIHCVHIFLQITWDCFVPLCNNFCLPM